MTKQADRAQARGLLLRLISPNGPILRPGRGFVDSWDLILNCYIGCEFACAYCYAVNLRPQGSDRDLWGSWTDGKVNAASTVERMLYGSAGNPTALDSLNIMAGTSTDPYQPVEKQLGITRAVLSTLAGQPTSQPAPMFGAPTPQLCIQTHSPLVCRDTDLMLAMTGNGARLQVNMTITTDSEQVRRVVEPKCMSNDARLEAVRRLSMAGIETCVTVTPFLAVDQPAEFAKRLAESGAVRFISQPLHPTGKPDFSAASRPGSEQLLDQIHAERGNTYRAAYQTFRDQLRQAVTNQGLTWMGEGKKGFRPPW